MEHLRIRSLEAIVDHCPVVPMVVLPSTHTHIPTFWGVGGDHENNQMGPCVLSTFPLQTSAYLH